MADSGKTYRALVDLVVNGKPHPAGSTFTALADQVRHAVGKGHVEPVTPVKPVTSVKPVKPVTSSESRRNVGRPKRS